METMNSSSKVPKSISDVCHVVTLDELMEIISQRKEGDINILVTGDNHIAARNLDNKQIISRLNKITSKKVLRYTDSVVLNGDLLDHRISLASEAATDFILFSLGLLNRCKTHGVSLDILEGTPSHDNRQPAILTLFDHYEIKENKLPLRYIDRVSVHNLLQDHQREYVLKHYGRDLKSLFIPDEVSTNSQVTWGMVKETLALSQLESVDMSYMHGTFRYQEPLFTEKSHVEENYESITNQRIIINHWHQPSAKGKIRAPGSLERLRHGEEETKGFYYCVISPDSFKEYFVINEEATIFKTIDVSGLSISEVHGMLDNIEATYPTSRIRLQLTRLDETYPLLSEIRSRYKELKITEKIIDTVTDRGVDIELINLDSSFSIRPDNIHDLVLDKMKSDGVEKDIKERVKTILGAGDECRRKSEDSAVL